MLTPHFLGGEAGHRGIFGGGGNRERRIGLAIWGLSFAVLSLTLQGPGLIVSVVLLVLIVLGTARRGRGTLLDAWRDERAWSKKVKKGLTRYRPLSRRPPNAADLTETELNAYRDWPEGAEGLYWLESARGRPGIAWHLPPDETPYLSVVWRIGGAIAGLEDDERVNSATRAYGGLLAETGRPTSLIGGIQMVTEAARLDMAPHEAWVIENAREGGDATRDLFDSYGQLVGALERSGMAQEHYIVVQWHLSQSFEDRAALRGPAQAGWLRLMNDEIRRMTRRLERSRLGDVRTLTARQVVAVLRHMQMPSWPSSDTTGIDPDEMGLPYEEEKSFVALEDLNPNGQVEQWLHRTAEVSAHQLEAAQLDALWLMPILSGLPEQIQRRVSTHTATRPAGIARRAARADLTSDIAEMREQRRKGYLMDDTLGAEHQAAKVRHADLKPGTGVQGAGWALHITISARGMDELRLARDIIQAGCSDAGIGGLHWLDAHQAGAMCWTWPIGRGMTGFERATSERLATVLGTGDREDEL